MTDKNNNNNSNNSGNNGCNNRCNNDSNVTNSHEQFRKKLKTFLSANCSGLYVESAEIEAVIRDVNTVVENRHGFVWRWDIARGLQPIGRAANETIFNKNEIGEMQQIQQKSNDAIAAIENTPKLQEIYKDCYHAYLEKKYGKASLKNEPDRLAPLTLILENIDLLFHTNNPLLTQCLLNAISDGRRSDRSFLLVGTDFGRLPAVLEHALHRVERPLPDETVVYNIAVGLARSCSQYDNADDQECLNAVFPPDKQEEIFRAVNGLTETDIEDAYAITLAEYGVVSPKPVFEMKAAMVRRAASLDTFKPKSGFEMLGGLEALKEFTLASVRDRVNHDLFPKGVLLTGIPGSGKTAIAKCLGQEVGLPVIELSLGKLLGKYVGESEHSTARTIQVIERMAPIILVIDELEKAISGSSDSGSSSDGGVMRRILGAFLTWLQDKTSEVYVIGTCNDISSLPPELSRAGRFDAVFFLDFPDAGQRKKIWNIYRKKHAIPASDGTPKDIGWTGTEIEHCCQMARMMGKSLLESAAYIVPVGKASRDKLEQLREYAAGRFLDANRGGLYDPRNSDAILMDHLIGNNSSRRRVRTDILDDTLN
jgi:hypothetical protein